MSTYSWSYKTPPRRQIPEKQAETKDPNSAEENAENHALVRDKFVLNSWSLEDNTTGTTKRLNWRAKIYVGNLNKKTNEASLAYYFSVFGDIDDIKLIRDHNTNESRGFAFVTYEKVESAEKAKKWCSFNYPTLDDNSITVASAERKSHKIRISKNEQLAKRDPSQTLFWEFKWKNMADAQVYGPYETSLMQAWKNSGYFDAGCWVRQVLHRQRAQETQKIKPTEENVESSESPCKKPKLVMDYSDSEDEIDDGLEIKKMNSDVSSRNKQNNSCLDNVRTEYDKRKNLNPNCVHSQPENGEEKDSKLNTVATNNFNASDNELSTIETIDLQAGKDLKQAKGNNKAGLKLARSDLGESTNDNKQVSEIPGEILEQNVQKFETEDKQNEDIRSENIEPNKNYNKQSVSSKIQGHGKDHLNILELYEQEATVLSEEQGVKRQINEQDYSSSEEEDIEEDTDDISTEFVAISEIDFNLYP